jgi:hypothetical protein
MSGIAMQTEFQLLAAKLSEKADNLELAEEQLWELFATYQGTEWDGEVDYPDDYSIQDEARQYQMLQTAKATATGPEAFAVIDQLLIELVSDDTDLEGLVTGPLGNYADNIAQPVTFEAASAARTGLETNPGANPATQVARVLPARATMSRTYFTPQGY